MKLLVVLTFVVFAACPSTNHQVAPPPDHAPSAALSSEVARTRLERIVARSEATYPHFTADGGPKGVLPLIDALDLADESLRQPARDLTNEAQAAYDALDQATHDQDAAIQAVADEAPADDDDTTEDDGGWGMIAGGGGDTSATDRVLATMAAAKQARAATDASDLRLVAALRALIASNDALNP